MKELFKVLNHLKVCKYQSIKITNYLKAILGGKRRPINHHEEFLHLKCFHLRNFVEFQTIWITLNFSSLLALDPFHW